MNTNCLANLDINTVFTRQDFQEISSSGEAYANKLLQRLLKEGEVARVGRNRYQVIQGTKTVYQYEYSVLSKDVASLVNEKHPYIDFTLFELVQLNYFVNHLYGGNIVFLFVESGLEEYVFQTLAENYPGKVMLLPDAESYNRYVQDGTIVILRLMSEAPKGKPVKWNTRLEKLVVDLFTEPLLLETVSPGEYPAIIGDIFSRYIIDEDCLFRYARRRSSEQKIRNYIAKETDIKLRTEARNA